MPAPLSGSFRLTSFLRRPFSAFSSRMDHTTPPVHPFRHQAFYKRYFSDGQQTIHYPRSTSYLFWGKAVSLAAFGVIAIKYGNDFFLKMYEDAELPSSRNSAKAEGKSSSPRRKLSAWELENSFIKKELEVIKKQIYAIKQIDSDLLLLDKEAVVYEEMDDDARLKVALKFNIQNKEVAFKRYYYLSEYPNMEALEQAINADLAFGELFAAFPSLVVKTDYAQRVLLMSDRSWLGIYRMRKNQETMDISEYWNEKEINIARLREASKERGVQELKGLRGEKWIPSLRVVLPIFNARTVKECPEIVDLISGRSWRESAPVSLKDLSYLRVAHWDFDGNVKSGELIVHVVLADEVLDIFRDLYKDKFKIEKMKLVDRYFKPEERYGNSDVGSRIDDLSMGDNNSSAFFFRLITGGTRPSAHSAGSCIDLNPGRNAYIKRNEAGEIILILPKCAEEYLPYLLKYLRPTESGALPELDESLPDGVISKAVVEVFARRGWSCGAFWKGNVQDFQHFHKWPREGSGLPPPSPSPSESESKQSPEPLRSSPSPKKT